MLTLKVINLYAGPGAGKSTLATGLFNLMKNLQHRVELVTEYAKDVTYEKNFGTLQNQLVLLAEQDRRLRRLEGQVEWAITDSPLPLGLAYMTPEYDAWLPATVWGAFRRYRNYHILVERSDAHPYQAYGRNQTEGEALRLDTLIGNLYDDAVGDEPDFALEVLSTHKAPYEVYDWLMAADEEVDA